MTVLVARAGLLRDFPEVISYVASRQGNMHYKLLSMKLHQSVFLIVMTLFSSFK